MANGPLTSIFAVVNTQITANLAAVPIVPEFGDSAVDRKFEALPPRIVWVPTDEEIDAARGQGGDVVVDGQGNMNLPGGAQPPIASRLCTVECDIWGATRDDVDLYMINAVFSAVHDCLSQGSYGVLRGRWVGAETTIKEGEVYRIWFQFFVPILRVRPQETVAVINTIPITPDVDDKDSPDNDES